MAAVRAVLVISNLEYGGAQRQVVTLANHSDPDRCDIHICSLSDYVPLAADLKDRDRRLHVISKKWKFDLTVVVRLARLLRRLRADIVHGYLFDAAIAARLAGRLAGTPVVVGSERNTDYRLTRRQRIGYRLTRGCVDVTIANSNAGAAFNSRMLGHPPSHYRVVHNGVDTTRFTPGEAGPVRRELAIEDDEPVVGMFASFKPQKNHPLFFEAAARILTRLPRARFLLVGDELHAGIQGTDEHKRNVGLLVDRLGIRPRCLFLGNRQDVERLYRACDVTVLPSFHEGTPNVALESMACGVPVVATDVADNAYVIPDGRVGYIVPLGGADAIADRVCELVGDAGLRPRIALQAREWVESEFSLSRLASKTASVYEEALSTRLGRGLPKDGIRPESRISAGQGDARG